MGLCGYDRNLFYKYVIYIMSENLLGYENGGYIYNPNDFDSSTTIDAETLQEIISELDPIYVNVNGSDVMNGDLTVKSVTITDYLNFNDNTVQTTAFNANLLTSIQTQITTLQTDLDTAEVLISDLQTQTTDISYDAGLQKTTIANSCLINNLICNNFNTSHLSGTSDNIQKQINDLISGVDVINIDSETIEFTETINNITAETFDNINMISDIYQRTQNITNTGSTTETQDLVSTNFLCTGVCSVEEDLNANGNANFQQNLNIHGNLIFNYSDADTGIDYTTSLTGFDVSYLKTSKSINTNSKLSNISYNTTGNLTTISGNTYLNSFTAGNINTAHLNNTASNVQSQLTALQTKTTNMTYNINTGITTIGGTLYINSFTAGNINTAHLNNTSQNIQTQINTANSNIASNTSSINTNTSNIATNTSDIATNTSNIATNTSNIASNTSNISTLTTNTQNISSSALSNTSITGSVNVSSNVSCNTLTVASSDINTLINGAKSYAYEFTFDNNEMIGENTPYLPKSTTYNDTYLYSSNLFADSANNIFNSDGTVKTGKYQVTLTYGLTAFYSLKKLLVKFEVRRRLKSNPSSGYLSWYSSLHHGFQNNGSLQYPQYGGSSSGIFTITTTNGNLYDHLIYTRVECDIFTEDFNSNNSQFQGKLLITKVY
jgi:hypothetical protein